MNKSAIYEAVKAMQNRNRRALASRVGYANLPAPSYRLTISIERSAAYENVGVRFAAHVRRVDAALAPSFVELRRAA